MKYRPEIDGLRTIAVLSVLVYHAEFFIGNHQLLKGGYLGVDVFFVISGYLITSLILNEHRATGTFSFLNFYERRGRRLLPALLTVMLASLPVAWLVLMPTQLIDFSKSLISSIFFASNFYWHVTLQEYGAESALLKPFLHTWSLAIEEQYYVLFPILLLGIYRFLKTRTLGVLSACLLLSLCLAELINKQFGFYMLPTRFWELLAGALLAHRMVYYPLNKTDTLVHRVSPFFGIFLITYSVLFIEFNDKHPGLITLIPVIGTVLIIWLANPRDRATSILSSKLFVAIGLVSYSLYLWHYPIFAFGRIIRTNPDIYHKLTWFILSGILSFFTYKFVETPFRNRTRLNLKQASIILALMTFVVLGFAAYAIQNDGARERFPKLMNIYGRNEFDNRILKRESWAILNDLAVASGYEKVKGVDNSQGRTYEKSESWYSSKEKTRKILIIGNSHAKDLFNAFYLNRDLFPQLEFARYGIEVTANSNAIDALIGSPNFRDADFILISTKYGENEDDAKDHLDKLPAFIDRLKKQGKRVLISSNTVEFIDSNIRETIFDRIIKEPTLSFSIEQINRSHFDQRKLQIDKRNQKIKMIADQMGVKYLDKTDFICDLSASTCTGVTPDGYKTFYDYGHYTVEGAKYFGKRIHEMNWLDLDH